MFPPVKKMGGQLNKIEIKHMRAYPSAEASMISLVEFPPSESAETCLGTNSEGVMRNSQFKLLCENADLMIRKGKGY